MINYNTFDVDHIEASIREWTSMYAQDVQQKRDIVLRDQATKHAIGFIADEFWGGLRVKWYKLVKGLYLHGPQNI